MRRLLTLGVVAALVVVTACSPRMETSPTVPPPTTTTLPGDTTTTITATMGISRFRNCMAAEGVDVPSIPLDGVGRPRLELALADINFAVPANAEALEACAVHLTSGALGLDDSPAISKGVNRMLAEFSECVRDSGVELFPDPVPDFTGVGPPFPIAAIPFNDPGLPAAIDRCRVRLGG